MIKKAILPVAGLGTRFLPASKSIPKEMVTVVDRPAIEYVVKEAVTAGIEQIILVIHSSKASIENYFDRNFELETTLENKKKSQKSTQIHPNPIFKKIAEHQIEKTCAGVFRGSSGPPDMRTSGYEGHHL